MLELILDVCKSRIRFFLIQIFRIRPKMDRIRNFGFGGVSGFNFREFCFGLLDGKISEGLFSSG